MSPPQERRQALAVVDGAIALIAVLLMVQMWLLSATLESYLRGRDGGVLPAAIASAVLFAGCLALSLFAARTERA